MKCPRCFTETFTVELYEGIEIDRCATCRGTWLDSGETSEIITRREVVFSSEQIGQILQESRAGVPEAERASELLCPKCTTAMESINYAYQSGVVIDVCDNGHGVWLDRDELEKIQMFSEGSEEISKGKAVQALKAAKRSSQEPLEDFLEAYKRSSKVHKLVRFVLRMVRSSCEALRKRSKSQ